MADTLKLTLQTIWNFIVEGIPEFLEFMFKDLNDLIPDTNVPIVDGLVDLVGDWSLAQVLFGAILLTFIIVPLVKFFVGIITG